VAKDFMTVRIARGSEVVGRAMEVIANAVTPEQLGRAQAVVLTLRQELRIDAMVKGLPSLMEGTIVLRPWSQTLFDCQPRRSEMVS
jgi:hypothetical protein